MGIVSPYLAVRLKGVGGDAYDEGRFPIGRPVQVAVVGGVNRCDANIRAGENINSLMPMTDPETVVPDITDQPGAWHEKGRIVAGGERLHCPFLVRLRISNPLNDKGGAVISSSGVEKEEIGGYHSGDNYHREDDEQDSSQPLSSSLPNMDHGPVQYTRTGLIIPSKFSSLSTKTSLLVGVRPFQRLLIFSSNKIGTILSK